MWCLCNLGGKHKLVRWVKDGQAYRVDMKEFDNFINNAYWISSVSAFRDAMECGPVTQYGSVIPISLEPTNG